MQCTQHIHAQRQCQQKTLWDSEAETDRNKHHLFMIKKKKLENERTDKNTENVKGLTSNHF